jgi:4-hydroxy-3-methylbut-2-enyl diphosphate reductase
MAAMEVAQAAEVVVVVGGANSNNTRELVATCRQFCPHVYHVQVPADLQPDWFRGVQTVGLTAGTSTPDSIIDGVEYALRCLAPAESEAMAPLPAAASVAPPESEPAVHATAAPEAAAALAA